MSKRGRADGDDPARSKTLCKCCMHEYKRLINFWLNEYTFVTTEQISQETIEEIRQKFIQKRQAILSFTKPWPPWALVHLLEIDDTDFPIPAEIMLYQALEGRKIGGIRINDSVVQVWHSWRTELSCPGNAIIVRVILFVCVLIILLL